MAIQLKQVTVLPMVGMEGHVAAQGPFEYSLNFVDILHSHLLVPLSDGMFGQYRHSFARNWDLVIHWWLA